MTDPTWNLNGRRFGLLLGEMRCYHCQAPTPVASFWIGEFQEVEDGAVFDEGDAALLTYIEWVDDNAAGLIRRRGSWIRFASTKTSGTAYWANHCVTCGAIQGDHYVHEVDLTRFWRNQFGVSHGLMLAAKFYENVDDGKGGSMELQFVPRTGETMHIACLWSHWVDSAGKEPDLYSFPAITDEPEEEVAAAGHDRTIINIQPEHVDAWLNPDSGKRDAMFAIFDDRQHPYYEHRLAA